MVLIRIQSREVNVNAQMLSHCTGLQTRHSSSRVKLFTTPHRHVLSTQRNTHFIFLNDLSILSQRTTILYLFLICQSYQNLKRVKSIFSFLLSPKHVSSLLTKLYFWSLTLGQSWYLNVKSYLATEVPSAFKRAEAQHSGNRGRRILSSRPKQQDPATSLPKNLWIVQWLSTGRSLGLSSSALPKRSVLS